MIRFAMDRFLARKDMENKYRPFGRLFCWTLTGVFLLGVAASTHGVQSAVNDAGTAGAQVIPPGYSGTVFFTNSNQRTVLDLQRIGDFRGGRISVLDFG